MNKYFVLAGIMLVPVFGSANLIQNGTFDLSVPNNGTGGFWTAGNNDGSGGWRSTGGNPGGTFILNAAGQTFSNPFVEQTVALVVGEQYRVSGDVAEGNIAATNNLDFAVEIDGNLWLHTVPLITTDWQSWTHTFIATSASATLRLSGEWTGDSDPRVDNITLVAEPIPEPTTMALLGLGAASLLRRRNRG